MSSELQSIPAIFQEICERRSNEIGLVFDEEAITFHELNTAITNLAQNLLNLGISKGDRVAIILPNCKEYIYSYFALFKIGAWAMPINTRWEAEEIENVFDDATPNSVIIVEQEGVINYMKIVEKVRSEKKYIKNVILVSNTSQQKLHDQTIKFETLLKKTEQINTFEDVSPADVAMLSYTSGTTGKPKGVMISHQNFVFTSVHTFKFWGMMNDTFLTIAPLYAAQGFLAMLINFVGGDSTMYFLSTFNPNDILKVISKGKSTIFHTQPTMWALLLASRAIKFTNFSSLNKIIVSGSLCSYHLAKKIEENLGCLLLNAYGLIEATSVVTLTRPEDSEDVRFNTVGRAIPGIELKIVDAERQTLPKGKTGELAVKGYLMKGYYNNQKKTDEAIDEDGWLYTGDMARFYDDENISIVGRCKDMIIRGGFNVYPIDVEEVILRHPDVQDAAVVGKEHHIAGEQIVAFVIPHPGKTLTKNDILNHCRGSIANYKIPDDVIFISQMPIILSGKIKKNTLRLWAEEGTPENKLCLFN